MESVERREIGPLRAPSGLMRLNTHSLFPRNNLIEGGSNACDSPSEKHSAAGRPVSNTGVRINQLKEMRKQALNQELEFVGKITFQQQAMRLPAQNAEQLNQIATAQSLYNQGAHASSNTLIRGTTPNRVGSSNLTFRKKKVSSVIQQLPPLAQ